MKNIKFYGFQILIFFIFLGASCSSIETNNIAPGFQVAFDSIKKAVFGFPENTFITREIVENIPYASLTLKIGKGPRGLLILESVNDNETLWVSRDNVYIRLENGRITRTLGLVNNIVTYLSPKVLFQELLKERPVNIDFIAYYSYEKPVLNNLRTKVKIREISEQTIVILGHEKKTIVFEEEVENSYLGWKVKNKYWVDPKNGFVWKSIQNPSPKLPQFTIEVTKKPAI